MLPLQFILLILVASLPGEIAAAGGAQPPFLPGSAMAWMGSLLFWQAAVALFVVTRGRRAMRALHDPGSSATAVNLQIDALMSRSRWVTVAITGVHLLGTGLPGAVFDVVDRLPLVRHLPRGMDQHVTVVPELVFLLPAMLAWLAIWTVQYFVETALHERNLPYLLAAKRPVHEMPPLGEFLTMQSRHNFFPILFLLVNPLFAALGGLVNRWFPDANDPAATAAQVAAAVAGTGILFLVLPVVLTRIWSTTPLLGPLRRRLDGVAARYRLRFRNILLWRTHHLVINAAILGWVPFGRYFLMSDSLLESFSDRQLEAVFAHEVGHGVHRHIPWYMATLAGAAALAGGIAGVAIYALHLPENGLAANVILSVLICIFGGLTLPMIAPQFEHQADWFACRHMAAVLESGEEAGHANPERETALPPSVVMSPVNPLPEELQWTLTTLPGAAEELTLRAYAAGEYAHATKSAQSSPAAAPTGDASIPTTGARGIVGAEVFISALDDRGVVAPVAHAPGFDAPECE